MVDSRDWFIPLPLLDREVDEGLTLTFCLTQSGMITARISSWIEIPRSSASLNKSLKLSSRRESMNFAIWSPIIEPRKRLDESSHYLIIKELGLWVQITFKNVPFPPD